MNVTERWSVIAALGQWTAAAATFIAVLVALHQTRRSELRWRKDEERRNLRLYESLLVEVRENRRLLLHPVLGLSKVRLHRGAWNATRAEISGLPLRAAEFLQDAYQYASQMNDVVTAALSHELGPEYTRLDADYNKIAALANDRFRLADRDLTQFLLTHHAQLAPFEEDIKGALF